MKRLVSLILLSEELWKDVINVIQLIDCTRTFRNTIYLVKDRISYSTLIIVMKMEVQMVYYNLVVGERRIN